MLTVRNKVQQVHYNTYILFYCVAIALFISQGACQQCKSHNSPVKPPTDLNKDTDLEKGTDVKKGTDNKKNAEVTDEMISKAKSDGYPFLADYLQKLQNGEPIDVNARDTNPSSRGETVAMQAAMLGDLAIFNLILKQNPDLNILDPIYHRPAITFAIVSGNLDIVNILLTRGVDLTLKSDYPAYLPPSAGKTPLAHAEERYKHEKWSRGPRKGTYKVIVNALKAKGAPS
jgi:hypothetical protein